MMKKLIPLLLLSPLAYAEEETFVCDDMKNLKEKIPTSLLVNTKDKYLIFDNDRYEFWNYTETSISAIHKDNASLLGEVIKIVEIDKISGWVESSMETKAFGFLSGAHKCSKNNRLID